MRGLIRPSLISRIAGVMLGAGLCGIGPAWAGGGGSDGGVSQLLLQQVCDFVGATSCPQLPTLTQIILAISDYQNTPPDFVRGPLGTFGACSVSGNPLPPCAVNNAVTTVNPLASSAIAPTDLPNLTPLAFQAGFVPPGSPSGTPPIALPVALGSQGANSFLYPVLTGPDGNHTLNVVLDYPGWTSTLFSRGQPVGSFTFPLVILNGKKETPLTANLSLTATCNGSVNAAPGCLTGTVTFLGTGTTPPPTFTAAQLGVKFGFQFAPSPNLSTPHGIFTFQLPVIVTFATDPVYFGANGSGTPTFINQFSGQPTVFSKDDLGFASTSVGHPIGVSPYPAPLCPANGCPDTSLPASSFFYGFCATVAGTPAAATFVSVGTEGTVYASSPVGEQPQCPSK